MEGPNDTFHGAAMEIVRALHEPVWGPRVRTLMEDPPLGAQATADFFPDTEGQPGIGAALQATLTQVSIQSAGTGMTAVGNAPTQGRFETLLMPYIHRRFGNKWGDVEPYFSFPYGFSIRAGRFQTSSAVAVGSFFHMSRQVAYSMELNVGVNNAESTLSGGVLYRFQ